MLKSPEFRELLVAELTITHGFASAEEVALAIQRFRGHRGATEASLLDEIVNVAGLTPEQKQVIEQAVADLLRGDAGDARASLARVRAQGGGPRALRAVDDDRYLGFEAVGEGGMGLVYMALDTEMNRVVAFKLVRPDVGRRSDTPAPTTPLGLSTPAKDTPASAAFEELKARFLQEAWVTGGLEHPGIVPVYELGQTRMGIPFYTMRFVRGEQTLRDAFDGLAADDLEGRLTLLEPFLKLCDTVRYAHSRGVLHRDLKPENVALGTFGEVVLLDWGLAKLQGTPERVESAWQERIREFRRMGDLETVAGAMGTPGYMSPEAASGQLDLVDARSDLYSLGVMLFELLTGRVPFPVKTFAEFVDCMLHRDPPLVSSVNPGAPEPLGLLAARCLARDPAARPADVATLARDIRAWQAMSVLEAEVQALLRDGRTALDAAEVTAGEGRVRLVDRAMAALEQVRTRAPDHLVLRSLDQRAVELRERGMAERETAARRRVLRQVGLVALVVVAMGTAAIVGLLDKARRSAERERDATARMLLLDDMRRLADLQTEAMSIDPLTPDLAVRVRDWLARAEDLAQRLPGYAASLVALDSASPGEDQHLVDRAALRRLVEHLRALRDGTDASHVRVTRLAASAATATHPAWPAAAARVLADERFEGLVLIPQAGLVPLGPDPHSGLEEFAHAASGRAAQRDPESRLLQLQADTGLVFVLLPPGGFQMGAEKSEEDRPGMSAFAEENEAPLRTETVAAFFLAKCECTQAQWVALAVERNPSASSWLPGSDLLPVDSLSAVDIEAALARHALILPSEVQWEYACRGGQTGRLGADAGDAELERVAWTSESSGVPQHADPARRPRSHPVGRKAPNGFGLHDMLGNVWEWCSEVQPEGSPHALSVGMRVFRGGDYLNAPRFCRPSTRIEQSRQMRGPNLGFRPARPLRR